MATFDHQPTPEELAAHAMDADTMARAFGAELANAPIGTVQPIVRDMSNTIAAHEVMATLPWPPRIIVTVQPAPPGLDPSVTRIYSIAVQSPSIQGHIETANSYAVGWLAMAFNITLPDDIERWYQAARAASLRNTN